jgi:hypothetical protein
MGREKMVHVPLIVSIAAFCVSMWALWKGHLAPFSPLGIAGNLCHRIYPIRSEAERWFISSFHVPISVTNQAARPGVITGLRIRLRYPDLPIPGNYEIIRPIWEIAPDKVAAISKDRFKWIDKVEARDWVPFVILPKATVSQHVVFEVRWAEPVIQNQIIATLELQSNRRPKWLTVATWRLSLPSQIWAQMADVGTGFTYFAESRVPDTDCFPSDLHKYTGTKAPLPPANLIHGDSYLDYPR